MSRLDEIISATADPSEARGKIFGEDPKDFEKISAPLVAAARGGSRALDFLSGVGRTAVFGGGRELGPEALKTPRVEGEPTVSPQETVEALTLQAPFPSGSELLERRGIPAGPEGPLGITPRGVAGLGIEATFDLPMSVVGGALSELNKVAVARRAAREASEEALEGSVRKGFKEGTKRVKEGVQKLGQVVISPSSVAKGISQNNLRRSLLPVIQKTEIIKNPKQTFDTFKKHGLFVSPDQLPGKIKNKLEALGKRQRRFLPKMDDTGEVIDITASARKTLDKAQTMRNKGLITDSEFRELKNTVFNRDIDTPIDEAIDFEKFHKTPSDANEFKKTVAENISRAGKEKNSRFNKLLKDYESDLIKKIEAVADKTNMTKAEKLSFRQTNQDLSVLLTAKPHAQSVGMQFERTRQLGLPEAASSGRRTFFLPSDAGIRRSIGKAAGGVADTPLTDLLIRRGEVGAGRSFEDPEVIRRRR